MTHKARLLFHSPCFDGIVSAVLTSDYLRRHQSWGEIEYNQVSYDVRDQWLSTSLDGQTAVVDFLYHPDAVFWADHHGTAFLNPQVRTHFQTRTDGELIFDESADSCAGLLWRYFADHAGYRNECFAELVHWAEKIDAARYDSVDEALSFAHPALQISASLSGANGHTEALASALAERSLEEVSRMPEVRERFAKFAASLGEGLARVKASARLRDEIAVFDVDARGVTVPRYAPYHFFPRALYSVGVVRHEDGAKITAMRNPWLEFDSVPLGDIFTRFGGGGHERVASALIPASVDPQARLNEIVSAITAATRVTA